VNVIYFFNLPVDINNQYTVRQKPTGRDNDEKTGNEDGSLETL